MLLLNLLVSSCEEARRRERRANNADRKCRSLFLYRTSWGRFLLICYRPLFETVFRPLTLFFETTTFEEI